MDADDLYGLPLDRFIVERGRLAKDLRTQGRRDDAADVAALRKPSVAAWAVNQLVRTQRAGVDQLFGAGQALREAQAALLTGGRGTGADLRGAMQQERAAVENLLAAARGLLSSEGHDLSPAVIERVADTLHAAALSDEAREAIGEGRLERELRHAGLGVDIGGDPAPEPKQPARDADAGTAKRTGSAKRAGSAKRTGSSRRAKDAHRAEEAKRAERERAQARRAARSAEAGARRRAERAVRSLSTAQERRDKAARALDDAENALADARSELDAATREHDRARAELDAT